MPFKKYFGKQLSGDLAGQRQEGARFALLVLTGINLLNFADRYVPSAVKELIKEDLDLNDTETTYPTTGMIFVYMIFAMLFGYIADKNTIDRRYILAAAVVLWSMATALAGLAQNLTQLVLFRSLVGVGEAAYSTIAPPMISDFFPHADRNIAYAIYFLAIPVGGALGFAIGSVLGGAFGWRVAFFGVGLPGVAAAVCVLFINNPVMGINDPKPAETSEPASTSQSSPAVLNHAGSEHEDETRAIMGTAARSSYDGCEDSVHSSGNLDWKRLKQEIRDIFYNKYFFCCLCGSIANNFALGGLAEWFPSFLVRYNNISISEAGIIVGAATVLGGIGGNLLGAKSAEYAEHKKVKNAYLLVSALYTAPAAVFFLLLINITNNTPLAVAFLFIAEVCVWTCLAPVSTVAISCIPPKLRAKSCGIQIFLQHVLGDMISPPIIGLISDGTGSLQTGLQITWMVVALSGLSWWTGAYFLPNFEISEEMSGQLRATKSSYYEMLFGTAEGAANRDAVGCSVIEETQVLSTASPRCTNTIAGINSSCSQKDEIDNSVILELTALKLNQAL